MPNEFEKDDFFKIDCEPHLIGDMEHINHFPGAQMQGKATMRKVLLGSWCLHGLQIMPESGHIELPH